MVMEMRFVMRLQRQRHSADRDIRYVLRLFGGATLKPFVHGVSRHSASGVLLEVCQ
jgi:hypothetical protein